MCPLWRGFSIVSFVQSVLYQRFHFSDFCYEASRVSFVVQYEKQPVIAAFPDLRELWGLSSNEAWFPGWPMYQALFPISLLSKYPSFLPQYHWHNNIVHSTCGACISPLLLTLQTWFTCLNMS